MSYFSEDLHQNPAGIGISILTLGDRWGSGGGVKLINALGLEDSLKNTSKETISVGRGRIGHIEAQSWKLTRAYV